MWHDIDIAQVNKNIRKIQYRIYKAKREGKQELVIWLQKHLVNGLGGKIIAVHQVTVLNKGRKTPGVDRIVNQTAKQKMELAMSIQLNGGAQPIRRVWIPKPGKVEKRPLGIPTLRDRAKQALAKLALEPEWEAVFEANSYGFRPGRRSHDAIEAIFSHLHYNKPKYVYDAHMERCFDYISHDKLLEKLQTFPEMRKQIEAWLKAGILEGTEHKGHLPKGKEGTPQGGVISPLLANIALHGLENHLKSYVTTLKLESQKLKSKRDKAAALGVIRYADDFVLIHTDKEALELCVKETKIWLQSINLNISETKSELKDGRQGFNFLGFQIIQVRKATVKRYKVKITPTKEAQGSLLQKVRDIIQERKAASSYALISRLSPVIIGWGNYYKYCECASVFHKLEHHIFLKLRAWTFRRDTKNSRTNVKERYFPSRQTYHYGEVKHKDDWVLVGKTKGKDGMKHNYLPRMSWLKSAKHVKVKPSKSPYDNDGLY